MLSLKIFIPNYTSLQKYNLLLYYIRNITLSSQKQKKIFLFHKLFLFTMSRSSCHTVELCWPSTQVRSTASTTHLLQRTPCCTSSPILPSKMRACLKRGRLRSKSGGAYGRFIIGVVMVCTFVTFLCTF